MTRVATMIGRPISASATSSNPQCAAATFAVADAFDHNLMTSSGKPQQCQSKMTLEQQQNAAYEYEQQRSGATDNTSLLSLSLRGGWPVGPSVVTAVRLAIAGRVRFTEKLFTHR